MTSQEPLKTQCCIAGGGPAGMMLGFLLARAGVEVIVLEKHADFFRDFRGDTIHPSTMQAMYELGILDDFLKVPHQEITHLGAEFNNVHVEIADFTHLNVARPAIGLMPQWDFLKFLETKAATYPAFKLMMNANVTDIIRSGGRVTGVKADVNNQQVDIVANLVVGADGRTSVLREKSGLKVVYSGVPIDVLWFRVSRKENDPAQTFGRINKGRIMILLNRDTYWQCAHVIDKGGFAQIQQAGLEAFRKTIAEISPFLADRTAELKQWDDIKLLTVDIDHLERWYIDGLLCIGDAAHAMSPIGGVGINLAIQDAIAAANILYKPLLKNIVPGIDILAKIQKRREFPTKVIQKIQITIQNNIKGNKVAANDNDKPPFFMRLLNAVPFSSPHSRANSGHGRQARARKNAAS